MADVVTWDDGLLGLEVRCRVCGHEGPAERVATVQPIWRAAFDVRRCTVCRSLELLDDPFDSSSTDEHVDQYIEGGVGVNTLAEALDQVDPARVRRFLDVGCNVGFALDLARHVYDWEVVGVEPSLAGRRGASDLGLDIRNEYLDADSDLGDPFDLVLASEVIEHVLDPLDFARILRAQLAPGGRLLLTTPAAEHVDPAGVEGEVLVALSPGFHTFLASAEGLEGLLRRAGFGAVRVERRRGTLHVIAAIDPDDDLRPGAGRVDVHAVERYHADTARRAQIDSALANGAATRFVRSTVSRGDFDAAAGMIPTMVEAIRRRHGLDLDHPASITAALHAGRDAPWHLANAAYSLGMVALVHEADPARAAELFELTVAATAAWERHAGLLDLDSADLAIHGASHRALALARCGDGADAVDATTALDAIAARSPARRAELAAMQCRVLVELVARGSYESATRLRDLTVGRLETLAADTADHHVVTVLDTAFSLGMLHLNTAEPEDAAMWFRRCLRLAEVRDDRHATNLVEQSHAHLSMAEAAGAAVLPAASDGWPGTASLVHQVDVYWTDASGTFLEGWAHLGDEAVRSISVRVGDRAVTAPPTPTPHLLRYWPDVAPVARAGFSAYVPGSPHGRTSLLLTTDEREVEVRLDLPAAPLPELPQFESLPDVTERIRKLIAGAPPGPILAIGIRSATEETLAAHTEAFGDREYVGFDIHPGLGVHVVGDAHHLADHFPADHFSVVVSTSVLEHVAMPWLVAAGCAHVLRRGGLAIHVVPWTWPTHSQPNDFWRISAGGLRHLFGPSTGFRAIDGGDVNGAVIVPTGPWRAGELRMPTMGSAASGWIAAEKVDERAEELRWTYDADLSQDDARAYPTDALAPRLPEQGWTS